MTWPHALSKGQNALVSAALRHVGDAAALLGESPAQAFYLAGYGPECARKACLARWSDQEEDARNRAIGHRYDDPAETALGWFCEHVAAEQVDVASACQLARGFDTDLTDHIYVIPAGRLDGGYLEKLARLDFSAAVVEEGSQVIPVREGCRSNGGAAWVCFPSCSAARTCAPG